MADRETPPAIHFLIRPKPFLVRAASREEAFRTARAAVAGAQFEADVIDAAPELIEYAEYLRTKHKQ